MDNHQTMYMSVNYLNEHKNTNGNRTTTITYCIDTGELLDTNQVVRSRGGCEQSESNGSPKSVSSFKRIFRSSSKNNAKDKEDSLSSGGSRRHSSENVSEKEKLNRTRSLKTTNQSQSNSNSSSTSIKAVQPAVQRSMSAHGPHSRGPPFLGKTVSSPPLSAKHLAITNSLNHKSNSNNFLKPISSSNRIDDIEIDLNTNTTPTPSRQSFMKRLSRKLSRKSKKSVKKHEQPAVEAPKNPVNQNIHLNIKVMKQVFDFFDERKKGYITIEDIEIAIQKLESLKDEIEFPTKDKMNKSFERYSKNGKNRLEFEEFLEIMRNVEAERLAENELNEMKYLFYQFDRNKDGKITRDELQSMMVRLFPGEEINDHDIDHMLDEADLDQNGSIDLNEFINLFTLFNSQYTKEKSLTRELVSRSIQNCGLIINMNNKKMQTIDLKQAFTMFDKNGDNKISPVELEEVMKYLGLNPSSDDVKRMIQVVDTNANGFVDYDEFISMMTQTKLKPRSHDDELREIFQVFDIDGNGFITADEIKTKMAQLGEDLTDDEVKEMIQSADINKDGLIDITEFSKLLQYAKGEK